MNDVIALPAVDPETDLLIAFRDQMRSLCGLSETQCDVEYDEYVPATQGNEYIVIAPAGMKTGEQHCPGMRREDLIYSLEVLVCLKIGNVATDRRRNAFTTRANSINRRMRQVMFAAGNCYDITKAANLALEAGGDAGRFIEPLVWVGCDDKPRMAEGESTTMVRALRFGGARFMRKW